MLYNLIKIKLLQNNFIKKNKSGRKEKNIEYYQR